VSSTMASESRHDRFGNAFAAGLPYARGQILSSGESEHLKLAHARMLMAERMKLNGVEGLFNLSGLDRGMVVSERELYNDEITPALFQDELKRIALEHLGGREGAHDILVLNRQSSALFAALMVLINHGDTVVGISADYTHPAVTRPTALLGGRFVDTVTLDDFERALKQEAPTLVVLTRLAVSYEVLSLDQVTQAIELSRQIGARILVDDAGGARVGPAIFGQPRLLDLDIDVGSTGLDKYGTIGPRLGLLGGRKELVSEIRARAFEYGLEARPMLYPTVVHSLRQYTEQRVRDLALCTNTFGSELGRQFGEVVRQTEVSAKLLADDILTLALKRAGLQVPPIVSYEATAAVAMLLLKEYGALSVHFAGLPPGTSALLFKFLSPEELSRFGGARKLVNAIDGSIDQLSEMLTDPASIRDLLLGSELHA
jgi:L-seryl-tRNA(Ser) seleniumtransferase